MHLAKETMKKWFETTQRDFRIQIVQQAEMAKRILDDNYDVVYDFFWNVLTIDSAYKILRARRCQVLFRIFLPIILSEETEFPDVKGVFISDNALVKYKNEILSSSSILIDDILIHGRGIRELYKSLDEYYKNNNIFIYIFSKNKSANLIDVQLSSRIKSYRDIFEWEWRSLSTQFAELIYASATPYISFVGSYIEKQCVDENQYRQNFILIHNANECQKRQGVKSFVLFEKEPNANFTKLCFDTCLRVYMNPDLEKTTYIPYVFLKDTNIDCMKRSFEWICGSIDEGKSKHIRTELLNSYDDSSWIAYKTRLYNALLNHVYGLYLNEKYGGIFRKATLDDGTLQDCYGNEVAQEILQLEYSDVYRVMEDENVEGVVDVTSEEDLELKNIISKINFEGDLEEDLSRYFYENGLLDENSAKIGGERKVGLSLGSFYNRVPENNKHTLSARQLNKWDTGIASCSVKVRGDSVAEYELAGEQSFRYVLEKYPNEIKKLIYLYNKPLSRKIEKSGEALVLEELEQILKETGDKDYSILEKFVRQNVHNLGNWGIKEILT